MQIATFLRIALAITATAAVSACTTVLNPARPPDIPAAPPPLVHDSTIAVPIKIDVGVLAQAAEAHLPTTQGPGGIYWISGMGVGHGASAQLGIHRSGAVTASTSDGCVSLAAPLQINNGRIDWSEKILFGKISKHFDFGGGGNVKIKSCLSVTPEWSISANLVPDFTWTESPWIDINPPLGHIRVSLQDQVDPALRSRLPGIAQQANQMVSAFDVRSKVNSAWQVVQRPIVLAKAPAIVLDVQPTVVSMPSMASEGNLVVLRPAITTKLILRSGEPGPNAVALPLPPNNGAGVTDDIFISLQAVAEYTALNDLIKSKVDGKEFDLGDGKSVTVRSLSVSGYGPRILIRMDMKAKIGMFKNIEGVLYLVGHPRYDDASRKISIADFNYDGVTNSLIVNEALALTRPLFLNYIRDKLVFDISGKVDPLRKRIEAGVKDFKVANGVTADIAVASIGLSDVFVTTNSIGIVTVVKGKAQINVTSL